MDEEAKKALVPSLILQPLVENSIKYAVADREAGGRITISGNRQGDQLVLVVADDGPGIPLGPEGDIPEFTGVGLINTRERLEQLYGNDHSVEFALVVPHGLKIEIRIPYETEL